MLSFLIKNTKYITFALLAFFGIIFFANAQTGSCEVTSAKFRTSSNVNQLTFYDEDNKPYVYMDIVSSNCIGQTLDFSITELDDEDGLDNINDDDINGTGGVCGNNNSSCMDNRPITITENQFTLALISGEDECESNSFGVDCNYYIRVEDDVVGGVNDFLQLASLGGTLSYECDGFCDDNWTYLGELDTFEGLHSNDPTLNPGGGGTGGTGGTDGGGEISPPNPVTTVSGPTVIDLGLTNPLAGTIDNLPQLFQKIVEIIIKIGIPLVAIAILYSGFLFVTARGNDSQLKTAKNALLFAVIGGLILLASWLVAEAIRDAIMTIND